MPTQRHYDRTPRRISPRSPAVLPLGHHTASGRAVWKSSRRTTPIQDFLPNRLNVQRPYPKRSDPRFFFGGPFYHPPAGPSNSDAFEIGTNNPAGWVACVNDGCVFVTVRP